METQRIDRKRYAIGEYATFCAILTFLYILSIRAMRYFDFMFREVVYTDLIILITVDSILFLLMLRLPYPLSLFGFNLHRWKRYTIETIVYSILFCVSITGLKWIIISLVPSFYNLPLIKFEMYYFVGGVNSNYYEIIPWILVYILFGIPLQIFVVHSAAQSQVLHFVRVKYRKLLSILVATLWFSVAHLSLPFGFAITMVLPGLFFSAIYSRQKSLLGVWIAHTIIGVWGLNFLDVSAILDRFS